jgi:DNA-binding transcriptional LysR family regulator
MPADLNALQVFASVVKAGSFTGAARALEMPKSTVSQRVAELEQRLGARLLQRTTRRLSLTDEGRVYYDHCARILAEVEDAERAVVNLQSEPRGLLRVTVPASTQFLGPVLRDFMRRHRGVQLEVVSTDRSVDLVEESFDLAIRAGTLSDSSLIARHLGMLPFSLIATPGYLRQRGRPRTVEALADHACLVFGLGPHFRLWRLCRGEETREISVTPVVTMNDLDMLHAAVMGSLGISMMPAYRGADEVRAGRLERVLPDWDGPAVPINAVYPSSRHLSPKVKALLDHLQRMRQAPWTKAPAP